MTHAGAPPQGELGRAWRIGRAALQLGANRALQGLRPDVEPRRTSGSVGHPLAAALLDLRGAALKLAQFLCLESDLLPPRFAEELLRSCHRVPPMSPVFAQGTLRTRLGRPEQHFSSFSAAPFAAASLGQVHAATLFDGTSVAVKLQYPGIREATLDDLRLLGRVLSCVPNARYYKHLLAELGDVLLQECNYQEEANSTEWFRERLNLHGVRIPRARREHSAKGVLTTDRLDGLHLDAWLQQQPSAATRDRAAQRLFDFFVMSLHHLGRLQADPNPGNMLFQPDGTVGLIDFGCTRWVPPASAAAARCIWGAAVTDDDELARSTYRDMGLFVDTSPDEVRRLDQDLLKPFRQWVAIPLLADRFDFGADARFISEGRHRLVRMLRHNALVGLRSEFVLIKRTLYGLYRLFERLGARVDCRALLS